MQVFQYNKPSTNRSTLIFDLDHTLIHSQFVAASNVSFPTKENHYKWPSTVLYADVLHKSRLPNHSQFFIINFKRDPEEYGIVYVRPHVLPFLTFCFEHCNVAFWSTGTKDYVHSIVLHLLCALHKQPRDIAFAWARRKVDSSSTEPKFIDVFTEQLIGQNGMVNNTTGFYKDMHYVFSRFPRLSRQHTILIDNLPTHYVANVENCILIVPPFSYLNTHDNVLQHFLELLQKLLKKQLRSEKTSKKAHITTKTTKTTKTTTTKTAKKNVKTAKQKAGQKLLFSSDVSNSVSADIVVRPSKQPLLITKQDLKSIEHQSPTHDNYIYPTGYITGDKRQHFPIDVKQFKKNQHVLVPHLHYYRRGKIRKLHMQEQMAEVCITGGYRNPPTTNHNNTPAKQRASECLTIEHIPFDQIVDVQYADLYGVL